MVRPIVKMCLLLALSSAAFGQFAPAYDPNMNLGDPGQDNSFLEHGMQYTSAEIEWSRIAASKSTNPDVKALAAEVSQDELPLAQRYAAEAKSLKVKVPNGLSGKEKKESDKLNGLGGADFDKEYANAMVKALHDDYGNLLEESRHSRDPSLQGFASANLDKCGARSEKFKALQKAVGGK